MNERINEEIGALLDGRLESGPRTELLARLAASDEDFDVFADTAAVLREAEEGESAENEPSTVPTEEPGPSADVIPLRPRRASGWRSPPVRWLAAAAVATIVLIPVLRSRTNAGAWRDLGRVSALASPTGATLPDDWRYAWDVKRGGRTIADDSGLAARLGAQQVDLEVAARSGNYDQTTQIALAISASLDDVDGGVVLTNEYKNLAEAAVRHDPDLRSLITSARENLTTFFGGDATGNYLALGGWAEAARLAAHRRDPAFFHTRESRNALEAAANLGNLDREAKMAVARLQAAVDQRKISNWGTVKDDLNTLQGALAR